jgi:hypothetical protein
MAAIIPETMTALVPADKLEIISKIIKRPFRKFSKACHRWL